MQDNALVFGIVGSSCRVAQRVVEKNLSRVAGAGSDIPGVGVGDRGDAPCFQHTGDQTHGLVAHRSERNQKRRLDPVLAAAAQDLGREVRHAVEDERLTLGQRIADAQRAVIGNADDISA